MADAARTGEALVRAHQFDDVPLVFKGERWPVDALPFEAPYFSGAWPTAQYLALRAAQRLALVLPRAGREALVRTVAGIARRADRRHAAAARDFVRTALPDASPAEQERIAREAWRHLLRVALVSEGIPKRVLGRRLGDVYDVWAAPAVLDFLAGGGGGVMLLSGHVGVWEAACPGVVGVGFRPAYGVGKAPRNHRVALHIQRMREAQGMRVLPRNGAMQAVPAAIRAGATVGMLLDHRPRQKPIVAPFFGRPAACDRSAAVLLRRVKAPIVFYGCYATDEPWRFELRFPRLIAPDELEGLGPDEVTARVNRELEALVLHRPDQYFWLHDRYRGASDLLAQDPEGAHARGNE